MPAATFLLIFPPLIEGGTTYWPVTVIRLFVVAALAVWLARGARDGRISFYRTRLEAPLASFLVIAVVSYFLSSYKYLAWQRLAGIISCVLVFYILVNSLGRETVRKAAVIAVFMGVFEAALGVVQAHFTGLPRARGTFFNPDFHGGYLAMSAPLILALINSRKPPQRSGETSRSWELLLLSSGLALVLYAVVLTRSRGAFAALAVSVLLFFGLRRMWKPLAASILVASAILLLTPSLHERFLPGRTPDQFAFYRTHIWKNAVERAISRPWGEGLGSYRLGTQRHNFPAPEGPVRYAKLAESAHNGYLQVAVEAGIAGLLALLWGITALLKKTRKALKDEGDGVLAVGAAAGLGAFFAHAAVDTNVLEPALAIFALFMASLLVIISGAREGAGVVSFAAGRWTRPAAAAFGVVMAVYVTMPLAGRVYFDSYAASAQGGKPCGGDALRDLGRAVALVPGNASYRSALASCHFAVFMDKKDAAHAASALSEMDEAVRLSPKDAYYAKRKALALSVLGMAARDGGKGKFLAEAYGWYLKAIALYPSQPDSYLAAAGLAPAAGKADEVPRLLAGALEYEPDYLPARLALARFYLASGDLAGARAQLEKIKEIQGLFSSGDYDILTRAGYQVDGKEVDRLLMEAKKPG